MTCSIRKEKQMVARNFALNTDSAVAVLGFSCANSNRLISREFTDSSSVNPFTSTHKGHYSTTAFKPYSVRPKEFAY